MVVLELDTVADDSVAEFQSGIQLALGGVVAGDVAQVSRSLVELVFELVEEVGGVEFELHDLLVLEDGAHVVPVQQMQPHVKQIQTVEGPDRLEVFHRVRQLLLQLDLRLIRVLVLFRMVLDQLL